MDIGAKIRKLRKTNGLTLEELASRSELSKGFLSQLERNLTSPSIATLSDILEALGTSLAEFFKEESDEKIVFTKEDYFLDEKNDHTICWIVPNAQKNQMEPILLNLPVRGKSMEIENHEGEEFGYVLKGTIRLKLENGSNLLVEKGETFYLDGSRSHILYNVGKIPAEVLWISTPPVF
ncbi:MAG: helix-turn-helix domain-containing protein [Allobaculum sp.]|nr:helix-turn-helix domain-containing protein [Allobaculum sp.]